MGQSRVQYRIFFDIETGGLDPQKHDVTQIAAIATRLPGFETVAEFDRRVRFRESAQDPEALKLSSYDPLVWSVEAVSPPAAFEDFCNFLKPYRSVTRISSRTGDPYDIARLVGHNGDKFDGEFFRAWYTRVLGKKFFPAEFRVLDTVQLAAWVFDDVESGPENLKLPTLCEWYGIEPGGHDALKDTRALIEVTKLLIARQTERRARPKDPNNPGYDLAGFPLGGTA